jgi:hypothetical protein
MFQGWRATLQTLLGQFDSVTGFHFSNHQKNTDRRTMSGIPPKTGLPPAGPGPRPPSGKPVRFVKKEEIRKGLKIGIYGAGGLGKSSLALQAPGPLGFIDLDQSLTSLERGGADLSKVQIVHAINWDDLRDQLRGPGWDEIKTIVLDTATKAEEYCAINVCETIKTDKGNDVTTLEGYGYGKGQYHNFNNFMLLKRDLDTHIAAGRNVIVIMHESKTKSPNPFGEDYLKYQPHLQKSDNCNIVEAMRNWFDELWFVSYDMTVNDNRASGIGSRVIYCQERPAFMAKTRILKKPFYAYTLKESDLIWKELAI